MPRSGRRIIGPIPPRHKPAPGEKVGRYMIQPVVGEKYQLDKMGQPVRDDKGNYVVEKGDTRDPRDYLIYEPGHPLVEGATRGLKLFRVEVGPEPIALVYARDEEHAIKVYKQEFGVVKFGEDDPKVTEEAA